ncbi:MAG: hypothetical protein JWQ27_547 [Ferruginibacter sp.]|nr:hypothetical protein [Ferruginibacter sp.]
MKKSIILTMGFILIISFARAQLLKTFMPSPAFGDSLSQVIFDFKHNYIHIQGESLPPDGDAELFKSKTKIPGAEQCVIYRFHSYEDSTASFQAIMYRGESYKEAAKIYRNTFRQVNKMQINSDKLTSGFLGKMEDPTEDLRFTSSTLKLATKDKIYKDFVAEVEMVNSFDGWEVHLNLHNKKNDADQ